MNALALLLSFALFAIGCAGSHAGDSAASDGSERCTQKRPLSALPARSAQSQPVERVAITSTQLLALDD